MKKYSIAWKKLQQEKHGGWAEFHKTEGRNGWWKWHYIANDTEYRRGEYLTKKDCEKYEAAK